MTIPEASQLVLQASAMGRAGEIFVLDMGAPVKIVDLARNLILLSGLRPDEDIKIEFTGMRPGEKLYEELNSMDEDTLPTPYEKIKIFTGNGLPSAGMEPYLEALRDICERRDVPGLVLTLKDLIPDYNPSANSFGALFNFRLLPSRLCPETKSLPPCSAMPAGSFSPVYSAETLYRVSTPRLTLGSFPPVTAGGGLLFGDSPLMYRVCGTRENLKKIVGCFP